MRWPKRLRKRIRRFYRTKCLLHDIDSTDRTIQPTIGHIDDDHSHTIFENGVPLCGTCNTEIQNSKGRLRPGLSGRLGPDNIRNRGKDLFGAGKFAVAYGCFRLAGQLFLSRFDSHSDYCDCLTASIGALRPLGNGQLLRYTVCLLLEEFLGIDENRQAFGHSSFQWSPAQSRSSACRSLGGPETPSPGSCPWKGSGSSSPATKRNWTGWPATE